MPVRGLLIFPGPSLFHRGPAVRLRLDPKGCDLLAANGRARSLAEQLEALLPEDGSLWHPSEDAAGDLCFAEVIARLALAFQREFGFEVEHHAILGPNLAGDVELIYAFEDVVLGRLAGRLATRLVEQAATKEEAEDLSGTFAAAMERLRQGALIPPTRRTLWQAERRGIPWSRLASGDKIVQLGQGHKLRRLRGCYLHDTAHLGVRLAGSKVAAAELLRNGGVPVPRHHLVTSIDAALAAAQEIGFPVVVKPNGRDMGTAVTINVGDAEGLRLAFDKARRHGAVLVERQFQGFDYRATVLNGCVIAVGRNLPTQVIGDGRSTIRELVEAENKSPRRSIRHNSPLKPILVEPSVEQFLANKGLSLESVPSAGETVALRSWWRHARDVSGEDLTGSIHPANRALLERAARLVGLNLAGVDFITPDISHPWFEVGGVVNEINPTPGLSVHVRAGTPDVHRIILDSIYPPGDDGRIPLVALLASQSSAAVAERTATILRSTGHRLGLAARAGVMVAGEVILRGDGSGVTGTRMVLNDPLVTAAVVEVSDDAVAKEGLGFDWASVAAVMDEPPSAAAARLLLEHASEMAVLNADLPAVAALASCSAAKRLCLVAQKAGLDQARAHGATGAPAVTFEPVDEKPSFCLWVDGKRRVIRPLAGEDEGAGRTGRLFALAIACGLGLSLAQITEGSIEPRAGSLG